MQTIETQEADVHRSPGWTQGPLTAIAVVLWITAVLLGELLLLSGQARPGALPAGAGRAGAMLDELGRGEGATLLVFVHPRCPCTHASLRELERVLARASVEVRCHVLVYTPSNELPEWSDTELIRFARSLPETQVHSDVDAKLARALDVEVSGTIYGWGQAAEPLFVGGVTATRGHEGGNDGSRALTELVRGGRPSDARYPAFGCAIVPSS